MVDIVDNKDYDYQVIDWLYNPIFEGTSEECEGVKRYLNAQVGYKESFTVERKEIKVH